ncbi:LOG family protein [Spongiimicrobium salis]|uniref:LOG family protein n=1 Tax=Spongiimicrobium salis TaxID=1667022 RepID=UPI00374D5CCA
MKTARYAALFGGSGNDQETKEYLETVQIGTLLAKAGYQVKNGGYGGMMEAVSKGVAMAKGTSIGVTCKQVGPEQGNAFLSKTMVTNTLFERLKILMEGTNIFIVQRGGIGTLSEIFLALDIIRKEPLDEQPKLYFIGAIWRPVIAALKATLIPEYEHYLFTVVDDFSAFETVFHKYHG